MHNIEQGLPVTMIPAVVVPQATTQEGLLRMQLQCNEGKNFSDYEYAVHLKKLRDLGLSNKQIADLLGKKESRISWYFRFLNLDDKIQDLMKDNRITGVDVYHILNAHKDNDKAVETIMKMKEMADANGEHKISLKKNLDRITKAQEEAPKEKKKITLSDNDFNKTIVVMDTVAIKNGLNKLFSYLEKFPVSNQAVSIKMIYDELKKGRNIEEVLTEFQEKKIAG
jgi:ParB-like chromosome segregation protein Spo0J